MWEYAHDPRIAREDSQHVAGSPLLDLDQRLVEAWFPQPGALVDLGCGTGRLLVERARRGFQCLGVDLSQEALCVARELAREQGVDVALVRANLCELDCLPDGCFDYALLMFGTLGMIAGAENRLQVLGHAQRLLRPGGLLALHAHNVWRHLFDPHGRRWLLQDRLRRLVGKPAGDTHRDYRGIPNMFHHGFSRGELLHAIRSAGFAVREIEPVPDPDSGPGRHSGFLSRLRASGWIVLAHRE